MAREYTVIVERGEDGYLIGSVPALHGCHTQGCTVQVLLERMREAILLCLEEVGESADDSDLSLELVGVPG